MINYPTVKDNLKRYIETGFPILYICTYEEAKADEQIKTVAGEGKLLNKVLEWNAAAGLVDFNTRAALLANQPLGKTLELLNTGKAGKALNRTLLVIKDAADQLDTKGMPSEDSVKAVALLKEIARKIRNNGIDAAIIIMSPTVSIPQELEKMTTILELGFPDEEEIDGIIERFMKDNSVPKVHAGLLEDLTRSLKGLTEFEIEDLLSLAVYANPNKELTKKSLELVFDQKRQMIKKAGILEAVSLKEKIEDIGGLQNLIKWLQKKANVFGNMKAAEKFGVATPKGVLIAGMPGCGKSLCAKAAGKLFDVPLLRLDMGRLMGKYVGESEENMRKAIQLAEAISPCVLWVDELEKAFAGVSGGSEVTTRLFGTFLTWMQEKTGPVFVLATANKIAELPPELLRKGRFDDIFYVDLPNEAERRKIFEIHINKRRKDDLSQIDINALVKETKGYTGADIEGVVCESIENVFVDKNKSERGLKTEDILECIGKTKSLSVIMEKELGEMKKIYEARQFQKASI
jgi:SpoVK/Ycf46/Vps4 family AAA+-type ATPase